LGERLRCNARLKPSRYEQTHGTSLATLRSMADQTRKDGPLDGSTSGTIGGGGRETGGPTERPKAPDMPRVNPDDAASGRLAPDAIDAATPVDDLKTPPSDVSRR
jgi:hypothetical protein